MGGKREGEGMMERDAVIIGGGPAGLAAAVALHGKGIRSIILLEREASLGGILRQCIHDGFGIDRFKESLTGPEYASRLIHEAEERGIEYRTSTTVLSISSERVVTAAGADGMLHIHAKAVILAVGCRERDRGAIAIPGERPAGVVTAGTAQAYINLYNRLPCHEAVILGSGDIGLIMARRLTLEGVKVHGVFEIQDHPNGLERNTIQCLDDYSIPLYLRHTITDIHGSGRVEGVTVSKVDDRLVPIKGTEREYRCDSVILSVGLVPDNALALPLGLDVDGRTRGVSVDENLMTSIPGIFSAGNCLHVHDLADDAALEAERLASSAARWINGDLLDSCAIPVIPGCGIASIVPMRISGKSDVFFTMRPSCALRNAVLRVTAGGRTVWKKRISRARPQNMPSAEVPKESLSSVSGPLEVTLS